jgi:cytochrome P450 family 77 subfamily A
LFYLKTTFEAVEQINKLKYLTAVIKETLRVHTPAAAVVLTPTQDTTLGGYDIPSGVCI